MTDHLPIGRISGQRALLRRLCLVVSLGLAAAGLSACGHLALPVAVDLSPDRVPLAPAVTFALPSAGDLGRSVEAVQLVTARYGEEVFLFEGRLSVTANAVRMVGTDPLGRRAMSLLWQDGRLEVDKADWLPPALKPEHVLADIVLLYWPDHAIAPQIAGAVVEPTADGRQISKDGKPVITITRQGDPWTGTARLQNLAWGYRLDVRSREVTP